MSGSRMVRPWSARSRPPPTTPNSKSPQRKPASLRRPGNRSSSCGRTRSRPLTRRRPIDTAIPALSNLWAGNLDVGFATTQGNAKTSSFNLSGAANRATSRDRIAVYYTSLFASSNASGKNITTANAKRGGIAYSLDLDHKWFVFGSVDLDSDQFQSLDLRFVPAGGLGGHPIKNEGKGLNLQPGAAGNREVFFAGLNTSTAELLLSDERTD